MEEFAADMELIFANAQQFNTEESQVCEALRSLRPLPLHRSEISALVHAFAFCNQAGVGCSDKYAASTDV